MRRRRRRWYFFRGSPPVLCLFSGHSRHNGPTPTCRLRWLVKRGDWFWTIGKLVWADQSTGCLIYSNIICISRALSGQQVYNQRSKSLARECPSVPIERFDVLTRGWRRVSSAFPFTRSLWRMARILFTVRISKAFIGPDLCPTARNETVLNRNILIWNWVWFNARTLSASTLITQ